MSTHSPSPPSYHLLLNLERHIPVHQTTPEDHIITFPHFQHPRGLWALQWLSTSWVPSSELVKGSSPSRPVVPKEPFLGLWLWGLPSCSPDLPQLGQSHRGGPGVPVLLM